MVAMFTMIMSCRRVLARVCLVNFICFNNVSDLILLIRRWRCAIYQNHKKPQYANWRRCTEPWALKPHISWTAINRPIPTACLPAMSIVWSAHLSLFDYMSICLAILPFPVPSPSLSLPHLSLPSTTYPSTYLPIHPSFRLSVSVSFLTSVCPSVHPSHWNVTVLSSPHLHCIAICDTSLCFQGLAFFEAICWGTLGASIIEDRGLTYWQVAAHELGHRYDSWISMHGCMYLCMCVCTNYIYIYNKIMYYIYIYYMYVYYMFIYYMY